MSDNLELRARFLGDANPFKQAAKEVTQVLDSMGNPMRNIKRESEQASQAATRGFRQLKLQLDPTFRATQGLEKATRQLNQQFASGNISLEEKNRLLALAQQRYLGAAGAADTFNTEVRASRFAAGNLMAQFQDIGVMMASGQSPFLLAVQQGSQINQVLIGMKEQGKSTIATLGAAFKQFLNPIQLVTFALIAGTAALGQWAVTAYQAWQNTSDANYGLQKYKESAKEAATEVASLSAEQETFNRGLQDVTELGLVVGVEQQQKKVDELKKTYEELSKTRQGTEGTAPLLRAAELELFRRKELLKTLIEYRETAEKRNQEEEEAKEIARDTLAVFEQQREAKERLNQQFNKAVEALGDEAAISRLILRYGEESAEVAGARAAIEAKNLGFVDAQAAAYVNATLEAAALKNEIKVTADNAKELTDKIDQVSGADMPLTDKIILLSTKLSISADEAERLLRAVRATAAVGSQKIPFLNPLLNDDGSVKPSAELLPGYDKKDKSGGGREKNSTESELEKLREKFATEAELQLAAYTQQQELLQQALNQKLLTQQEYHAMLEEATKRHGERMANIDALRHGDGLQQTSHYLGELSAAFATGNAKMLEVAQKFGAAEALVNAWRAYAQVIGDPSVPWFKKLTLAISVFGAAMKAVDGIKGAKAGGGSSAAGGSTGSVSGDASQIAPQGVTNFTFTARDGASKALARLIVEQFEIARLDNGIVNVRGNL